MTVPAEPDLGHDTVATLPADPLAGGIPAPTLVAAAAAQAITDAASRAALAAAFQPVILIRPANPGVGGESFR